MTLDETRRGVLDYAPGPYAVTRGPTHTLVYSNAAFHAVPGMLGVPTAGHPIAELFDRAIRARLTALLDRSLAEQCATRDQFLGPLGQAGTIWSCSVWPASVDAAAQELVVELRVATHTERTLSLQREVAERLLLSALRESQSAEIAAASHQRAEFLASAGRHLAESLDTDTTRKAVAGLTLPSLAEWCIVDLVEDDETMHRLTIVHRDPRKQALVNQLDRRWSPKPDDAFGVPAVLANPQPVLIADGVDEALAIAAHEPANLRVLRELGIGPLLTVPLIGRSKVLGAITFVSGQRDRAFTDWDIELAEGLAARSVLALESARLYGDALVLREKAEAAAASATKFIGTISHELRTPLNAIVGYVELMAEGIHGPVTDAQRVDLERITGNQRHLLVLVGELLNFMRVGSGRVHYEAVEVSIHDAVTNAVELLEPLIANKKLTCEVVMDCLPIVASADPDAVRQILINLISNAIKFTNPGDAITIICQATEASVMVTVTDNGRGIPADKLDLIFEPFVIVSENDVKDRGSIGLGLPISRDLARAMHGEITVESKPGQGSAFTLTLPWHGVTGSTEVRW